MIKKINNLFNESNENNKILKKIESILKKLENKYISVFIGIKNLEKKIDRLNGLIEKVNDITKEESRVDLSDYSGDQQLKDYLEFYVNTKKMDLYDALNLFDKEGELY